MKFNKVLCITLLFGGLLLSEVMMAQKRYQIGVCDWMVFKLARELGCDGLEMDMGGLGKRDSFDNKIRQPEMARLFRHTADSLEIKVGAVAMSGFYGQSFAAKQSWKWLVEDCLNTMQTMQAKVAFLPLGGCGKDWTEKTAIRKEIVFRLHEAGEMAAKRGMIIGIDTPLDAKENKKLLKEIDSPGIKIFYKFQTAVENKRDISKDLRKLGADNICGIHASNTDGVWLRHDKTINMPEIKATLDKLGWSGWLFVERSRDVTDVRNVKRNYGENVKYLKEVFQN